MSNEKAIDVDAYIAGAPPEARPLLEELRRVVTSTVPAAGEGISWGVPFYKYHGALAGFAAFKNHVSFGFPDELDLEVRDALERDGYLTGKKTLKIRFEQEVPAEAIRRMLEARARANEDKAATR